MKKYKLAIIGASGMVGRSMLQVLADRNFPIDHLYLYASKRSAGQKITFQDKTYEIRELSETSFDEDIDIALFSAGNPVSKKYAPMAAAKGIVVIDNSSAWRMDKKVPLVVPEVNPQALQDHEGIIANPNCSTIQAMVAIKPLYDRYRISRIVFSTYQAVSGSGVKGMKDLERGLQGMEHHLAYPHSIAKNCIPHIDVFMENGYTKEEMKMIDESKKILDDMDLRITATAVRVPVFYGHGISVNVEFARPFKIDDIYELLEEAPGIVLEDEPSENRYPLQEHATGKDQVYVGRIRRDYSLDSGLNFWVVADNMRKGAATNAVQIAELLIKEKLLQKPI